MDIIKIAAEIILCFFAVVGICAIGIEIMKFFAKKRFHGKIYSVISLDKDESAERQLRDLFDGGIQKIEKCEKIFILSDELTDESARICNIYTQDNEVFKFIPKSELEKQIN